CTFTPFQRRTVFLVLQPRKFFSSASRFAASYGLKVSSVALFSTAKNWPASIRYSSLHGGALDIFHNQVIRADVMQRANVRMIECSDRAGVALEALIMRAAQYLDGDRPAQARILCPVHFAHASGA